MRQTKILSIIGLTVLFSLFSCEMGQMPLDEENTQDLTFTEEEVQAISTIDMNTAKKLAQIYINESVETFPENTNDWSENTRITEAYPIFLDGVDNISYWECKAVNEGSDAGYILINTNKSDLLIPEYSTTGKTFTENFREKIGHDNFHLFRYGFSGFQAFSNDNNSRRANPANDEVLYSMGFPDFEDEIVSWRESVKNSGHVPYYSTETLNKIRERNISRITYDTPPPEHIKLATGNILHMRTPTWDQGSFIGSLLGAPVSTRLYPIGCGPTAWLNVFGFWKYHNNKTALLPGVDVGSESTRSYMRISDALRAEAINIASKIETSFGGSEGDTWGLTWPSGMRKAVDYAKSKGYTNTVMTYRSNLYSERDKYNDVVKPALQNKRPVVLGVNTIGASGAGAIRDHYVVIEEAKSWRFRQKIFFSWSGWINGDLSYATNFGWGQSSLRWIYAIDAGPDYSQDITACFEVFDINIK